MADYKTTRDRQYKAVSDQRRVNSGAFRSFVNTFGHQKAAAVFGVDMRKVDQYYTEGVPVWMHNAADGYMKRYAPMMGGAGAPSLDQQDLDRPDRFLNAMVREFPDTAIGQALRRAVTDARTRLASSTAGAQLSEPPTKRKGWIDYKAAAARRVAKINEAKEHEQKTGEVLPILQQWRDLAAKARAAKAAKLAAGDTSVLAKPHSKNPMSEERKLQLREQAAKARAAKAAKKEERLRQEQAVAGNRELEHKANDAIVPPPEKPKPRRTKAASMGLRTPVDVTPGNRERAVSLLAAAEAMVKLGADAKSVGALLDMVKDQLENG